MTTAIAVVAVGVIGTGGIGAGASTGAAGDAPVEDAADGVAAADGSGSDVVPDEYVVMLRPPAEAPSSSGSANTDDDLSADDLSARIGDVMARLDQAVGRAGGPLGASERDPIIAELPVIDGFGARLTTVELAALSAFEDVLSVEPNVRVRANELQTAPPSSGPVALPWGLDRIDQAQPRLDGVYDPSGTGAGVTAYVIDGGVWSKHQEFTGRVIEPMIDFVGDFASPARVDPQCMDHGTHVAGTIVGTNVGVAPKARVRGVRVLGCDGYGDWISVLRGMDWVASHAELPAVANMSLGSQDRLSAVGSAVRYMTAKGITVVVAAGNDGADACQNSPAYEPSAITVGASARADWVPRFSNVGPCLDLFAPGVNVLSASVDGADQYLSMEGTSMASPHVAGAAAIYLSAHPSASPDAVERAIVGGAAKAIRWAPPDSPDLLLQVNGLPDPVNKPGTLPVAHIRPPEGVGPIRVDTSVTFDGRGSFDPTGEQLSYEWRMQGVDGVAGRKPTLTTVVTETGPFAVTLKVTNASGVSTTTLLDFEVAPPPPPVLVLKPASQQIFARSGDELTWDASRSYDPSGGQLDYNWYFEGEGEPIESTGTTFSTTFEGGYAYLSLSITNEAGDSAFASVDIFEPPTPVISPSTADVQVGQSVTFDGSESVDAYDGVLSYEWRETRDGEILSRKPTFTRRFEQTGTFNVFLTVRDAYSVTATSVARVHVEDRPTSTTSPTTTTTLVPPPPPTPGTLAAVEPHRVLDTRTEPVATSDPTGPVTAGGVARFSVDGVPDDAAGVVLNVTAVNPVGDGHLTVYPCGTRPETSNVNYRAGVTSANAVVSPLGGQRELCVWSLATTDVVVDVTGYVPANAAAHSISSVRAIDTRGRLGEGRLPWGGVVKVPVSSVADVPADAAAVFVNVTAANPSADGHLIVFACGEVPGTSNVNYRTGVTKANMAVASLAADGSLCIKTHAATDVVVDVMGYIDAGGQVQLTSARELDTRLPRSGATTGRSGPVVGGSVVRVDLNVDPAKTAGVFLSVAAVNPTGDGHLTVFPCGARPTASMLNYRAGETTSNMAFAKVDGTGSVCVYTFATTDLIIDYNGSVAAAP